MGLPLLGCLSWRGKLWIRSTPGMLHLSRRHDLRRPFILIYHLRLGTGSTNGRKLIHDFMSETAFWGILHGSWRFLLEVPVKMPCAFQGGCIAGLVRVKAEVVGNEHKMCLQGERNEPSMP
jgi:hypothetical protein